MILQTSASAKIILLGEHAVVYGQPAIAVPVSSLRAVTTLKTSAKSNSELRLLLVDLLNSAAADELKASQEAFSVIAQTLSRKLGITFSANEIVLHSDIPVASGLGSGAAASNSLAKSLLFSQDYPMEENLLNEVVYEAERIHHGTPSGIDNSVIVYEKPVYFRRGNPIEPLTLSSPFTLLIGDTGRKASTRESVADVRKLYDSDPAVVQVLLDSIGKLVVRACASISRGLLESLGLLMTENHRLLQRLMVSSPELDRLVFAAIDAGALGAKLSGGGRGGNMIALAKSEDIAHVRASLLRAGAARVMQTTIS